jgi:hypothetical protein
MKLVEQLAFTAEALNQNSAKPLFFHSNSVVLSSTILTP